MPSYKRPPEHKDEDLWFKLTKRQWAYIIVCLAFNYALYAFIVIPINFVLVYILGGIVTLVSVGIAILAAFVPIRQTNYLKGGGHMFDKILYRRLLLVFHKEIYIKNLRDKPLFSEEGEDR